MTSSLVKNLEALINKNIDRTVIPYVKGNSIRIGKYAVRQAKAGWWVVYNVETNCQDARLFCKTAAVAFCKANSRQEHIQKLDFKIQKHYNDCVFYKYTMSKTKDPVKKEITETRYNISYAETKRAKQSLDAIIFGF